MRDWTLWGVERHAAGERYRGHQSRPETERGPMARAHLLPGPLALLSTGSIRSRIDGGRRRDRTGGLRVANGTKSSPEVIAKDATRFENRPIRSSAGPCVFTQVLQRPARRLSTKCPHKVCGC